MYEAEGTVKLIGDVQTFGSGFTKREFVLTTEEKYPQDLKFEVTKERCSLLDPVRVNDRVKVTFAIRGNEYKGRHFVNLNAWRIESLSGGSIPVEPDSDEAYQPDNEAMDEESPF